MCEINADLLKVFCKNLIFFLLGECGLFSTYVSVCLLDDVYCRCADGYNCVEVFLYINFLYPYKL